MISNLARGLFQTDVNVLALFRVALAGFLLLSLSMGSLTVGPLIDLLPQMLQSRSMSSVILSALYLLVFALMAGYKTRWVTVLLFAVACVRVSDGWLADQPNAVEFGLVAVLLCTIALPLSRVASLDDAMDRGAHADGVFQVSRATPSIVAMLGLRILALHQLFLLSLAGLLATQGATLWTSVSAFLVLLASASVFVPVRPRTLLVVTGVLSLAASGFAYPAGRGYGLMCWQAAMLAVVLLPANSLHVLTPASRLQARHDLRIYYDQPCGFCRKICYIFASFMLLGRCQIAAAQTDSEALDLLKTHDSWVVYDAQGRPELCWAAVLLLLRASPVWWPLGELLTKLRMGVWGKPVYRLIGHSRGVLSKITAALLPYVPYHTRIPIGVSVGYAVVCAGLFYWFTTDAVTALRSWVTST